MASTYTTSLKIQQIGNGEQAGTWGSTTNTNWNLIEQAVAGVQTITMANANYTLSNLNGTLDEARNAVIVVNGTNSGVYQVIAPLVTKTFIVSNQTSGGYDITIGASSGSLVTIPNGVTAQVYCDGTNFYSSQTGSAGNFTVNGTLTVTGTSNFVGIPTAPTAAAGTNTTQLATTAFVTQNAVLTGALLMWPTSSAPTGYLSCDGTAVSRTTYAALFAIIGTTFGAGDGSTTFNLPNYTDNMPIGVGTIATAVGITGGSKDAIVVSHTHSASSTVTDPGHAHGQSSYLGPWNGVNNDASAVNNPNASFTTNPTNSATTGISVSTTNTSTGVSGTNANLPPYLGINFIIKT